jgi:hypothetical protein
VRFDDGARFSGYVKSPVVGTQVQAVHGKQAVAALSMTIPEGTSMAPGERAPFVVLATGIPEGARASVKVSAVARPVPPAPVPIGPAPPPPRGGT